MKRGLAEVERDALRWAESAQQSGWIRERRLAQVRELERATPDELFSGATERPLVVGLFGGTGVGKSSLLNRVAGANVSQTGVARPTSRSVTLYAHEQVSLAELPANLPADRIAIRRHSDAAQRHVVWVDTPDLDSADEANRACTLAWLAHLDLLVYVASPERYRDDVGWRVLRDRHARHAWMFVMNRWDEGGAGQDGDWLRVLQEAGFEEPLLIRTSCAPSAVNGAAAREDELAVLLDAVRALFEARGVERLTSRRMRVRSGELATWLEGAIGDIGDEGRWRSAIAAADAGWAATSETIRSAAAFGVEIAARRFAARQSSLGRVPDALLRLVARGAAEGESQGANGAVERDTATQVGSEPADARWAAQLVWDRYAEEQVAGLAERSLTVLERAGLPAAAAQRDLATLQTESAGAARGAIERSLRGALAAPGRAWQRTCVRVLSWLMRVLPIGAAGWIAYAAVVGFHRGASGGAYVGSEFLFSAGALMLVAWGLPALLRYSLQPSIEETARHGLRHGLNGGLEQVGAAHSAALASVARQAREAAAGAAQLREELRIEREEEIPGTHDGAIRRLVTRARQGQSA